MCVSQEGDGGVVLNKQALVDRQLSPQVQFVKENTAQDGTHWAKNTRIRIRVLVGSNWDCCPTCQKDVLAFNLRLWVLLLQDLQDGVLQILQDYSWKKQARKLSAFRLGGALDCNVDQVLCPTK
jgi:hypothetical protein